MPLPIALIALTFHSRTVSVGSAADTDVAGISSVAPITTMTIGAESQRRTLEGCADWVIDVPPIGAVAQAGSSAGPL